MSNCTILCCSGWGSLSLRVRRPPSFYRRSNSRKVASRNSQFCQNFTRVRCYNTISRPNDEAKALLLIAIRIAFYEILSSVEREKNTHSLNRTFHPPSLFSGTNLFGMDLWNDKEESTVTASWRSTFCISAHTHTKQSTDYKILTNK
jgi:hypothetical protein